MTKKNQTYTVITEQAERFGPAAKSVFKIKAQTPKLAAFKAAKKVEYVSSLKGFNSEFSKEDKYTWVAEELVVTVVK